MRTSHHHGLNKKLFFSFQLFNFGTMGLFLLMGITLFSGRLINFYQTVIHFTNKNIYNNVVNIFIYLYNNILIIINYFIRITPRYETQVNEGVAPAGQQQNIDINTFFIYEVIVFVLLFAVFMFLLFILFKFLVKLEPIKKITRSDTASSHVMYFNENKINNKQYNKIKKYFHLFLKQCFKKGMKEQKYKTSADYVNDAEHYFKLGDTAGKLRELYIPVRYGNIKPSRETVQQAKQLYNEMKLLLHPYPSVLPAAEHYPSQRGHT
jgi:hypothetical protein